MKTAAECSETTMSKGASVRVLFPFCLAVILAACGTRIASRPKSVSWSTVLASGAGTAHLAKSLFDEAVRELKKTSIPPKSGLHLRRGILLLEASAALKASDRTLFRLIEVLFRAGQFFDAKRYLAILEQKRLPPEKESRAHAYRLRLKSAPRNPPIHITEAMQDVPTNLYPPILPRPATHPAWAREAVRLARRSLDNERPEPAKRYLVATLLLNPTNPDLLETARRVFHSHREFEAAFMRLYFQRNHQALVGSLGTRYRHLLRPADIEASFPCEIWLENTAISTPAARTHKIYLPAGYCTVRCVTRRLRLVLIKAHDFTVEKRYRIGFRFGIIRPDPGLRTKVEVGGRLREISTEIGLRPGRYNVTVENEDGQRREVEIPVVEGEVSEVRVRWQR
jgi:hypothetical protein